jgi:transcriptional regulator
MYLPKHFEESRPEVLHALVRQHPLALLITMGSGGLLANPVPFMLEPAADGGLPTLRAHVARANPLWRESRADVEALVVFQGPQAYVSPSFYPVKAETGKVVPTWNYVVVQARGPLRVVDDAPWLHALVTRLTDRHESPRATPWAVSDAPDDYIATMLRAIVGIEIPLTALTGKWKVHQNHPQASRDGVVRGLQAQNSDGADPQAEAIADWVARSGAP